MPNRVGQQLGSHRLVRLLGRTALAEVYLAEHLSLNSQVAIKVLLAQAWRDDPESFTRAARSITVLTHPHVIRVLECGVDAHSTSSLPFLVMDYAPNGTLRQRHPIGSRLALATILPYVKQIAEPLHQAHHQSLIHCDIKPENILLGSDNQLLLSEFSTALISSSIKSPVGTMAYMAPEQIRGQPCPVSDEYALGIMIYEWLCGELPFYGSLSEIADQHLLATPPPLRALVPGIPPDVEEVVMIALAKDPQSRFTNLLAFANAFEQASQSHYPYVLSITDAAQTSSSQQGSSVRQTRPGIAIPLTGRVSRRAVIAGLSGLVVAGSGALAWLLSQKETPTNAALSPTMLTYHGNTGQVTALAWSPNGRYIASGGDDHTIQIWNALTGANPLVLLGSSGGIPAVTWSPDSTRIASASAGPSVSGGPASDNSVQVWNASTGESIYAYHGHSSGITDVVWSPNDERIASSSTDYTVQIWNATNGQHPLILRSPSWYAWTIAWSPDGRRLATGGPDNAVQIWDTVTGNILYTYHGNVNGVQAITWSPEGTRIASTSSDATVRVWDTATGKTLRIYRGHTNFVVTVAWSADGKYIASGSLDKTVQVWDPATANTLFTYRGHTAEVTAVVWSPDSKYIASASDDGTVQVLHAL